MSANSTTQSTINVWPPEVLARQLVAEDPLVRTMALGMAVQEGAPIGQCVEALVHATKLAGADPLASKLAAVAIGALKPELADARVQTCLADLVAPQQAMPTRVAAAHAMFRLRCVPSASIDSLCAMLFDTDVIARKVALLALTPFATAAASSIVAKVGQTAASHWTNEAMLALVQSAGNSASSRRSIEIFVTDRLVGAELVPTGIAGYAALATLNPRGSAVQALVRVAERADEAEISGAALQALGDLGETARSAAAPVAAILVATDESAREELLCHTLVKLRAAQHDVPLARVLHRVAQAPDRGAAAHCMLLCLHPKEFGKAAVVVRRRFEVATEALRPVLSQTHRTLCDVELDGQSAVERV